MPKNFSTKVRKKTTIKRWSVAEGSLLEPVLFYFDRAEKSGENIYYFVGRKQHTYPVFSTKVECYLWILKSFESQLSRIIGTLATLQSQKESVIQEMHKDTLPKSEKSKKTKAKL